MFRDDCSHARRNGYIEVTARTAAALAVVDGLVGIALPEGRGGRIRKGNRMPGGVSHGLGSTESHAQLRSEQHKYSLVATGERPDQRADLRYFGRDAINGVLQIHSEITILFALADVSTTLVRFCSRGPNLPAMAGVVCRAGSAGEADRDYPQTADRAS